jgi:Zinc carboxypeptidase
MLPDLLSSMPIHPISQDKLDKDRIGPVSVSAMEAEAASWGPLPTKKSGPKGSHPKLKPALFFSGRVHPGETPASWMMKGMLEFLTGDSPQAVLLRQIYVIYIVPILNPDGVSYGNNRCSLAGEQ